MDALARTSRRIAFISILVSAALAVLKIIVGLRGNSTAVVSDGLESASDVFSSGIVLLGLTLAMRPADRDHPYGHGRFETLSALLVGSILSATGALICFRSLERAFERSEPPALYAVWPLFVSIACKVTLWTMKRRVGSRIGSEALLADASNDAMDIVSAVVALAGLSVTLVNPQRFAAFDHVGGFGVGLIVIIVGLRVVRDTVLQLIDTMPDENKLRDIKGAALQVPGALAIEKCFARKTGLKYHVDLHLEVDPKLTVQASHEIATEVRARIKERLDWVADVLVHVEPHSLDRMGARHGE